MTGLPKCVVDASVGIKLFVDEELSEVAELLFAEPVTSREACRYVPDLFFIECANVLWKYVLRYSYPPEDARRNLSLLYDLSLDTIAATTLISEALNIALAHSISVYDACYVATADLVEAPLVTADERLVKRLEGTKHQVCFLGSLIS